MKRILLALLMAASSSANAQMNTGMDHAVSSTSYTGPGDVISGAIIFWGLRAYNKAWATAHNNLVQACTAADASCQNVPSDSSGNFNLGATSLGCNNSTTICTIKTFYDQSGNNSCGGSPCDLTQATGANRATLVVPGAANGCSSTTKYCASTADGDSYTTSANVTQNQPFTVSFVYQNPTRTRDEYILDTASGQVKIVSGSGGGDAIGIQQATLLNVATNTNYHALQGVYNNASSDVNIDGTSNTGSVGGATGINTTTITLFDVAGFGLIGFFDEMGIWPSAFSGANSTSMSSNQHSYWGF